MRRERRRISRKDAEAQRLQSEEDSDPGDFASLRETPDQVSRRDMLGTILRWGIVGAAGAVVIPIAAMLLNRRSAQDTREVVVCRTDELPLHAKRPFRIGSTLATLVHLRPGSYLAFASDCTHGKCTVEFRPQQQDLWCPCHEGRFNLQGRVLSGPPPLPLETFRVEVRGGEIRVSRRGAVREGRVG